MLGRIHGLKSGGGTNHDEREERGDEKGEVWRRVSPSHRKRGLGAGAMPPYPNFFFFDFELKMTSFGAFWELILLQLYCLTYTHKPLSLDISL